MKYKQLYISACDSYDSEMIDWFQVSWLGEEICGVGVCVGVRGREVQEGARGGGRGGRRGLMLV